MEEDTLSASDYSDTAKIQKRLADVTKRLGDMTAAVANARTIKEYDGERRKRLLSCEVVKAYKAGAESATEAEHQARASDAYRLGMDMLQDQRQDAEKVLAEYDALRAAFDTGRSLLAMQRTAMQTLDG